ncbi:RlmE family RNA methyltransferase [Anaplasma bovis]|uniref:RlmE family RNA methyltransferase n=1 Tax=Anaplasma bovis TaxID=186733 RepID=UPI002FF30A62
MNDKFVKLAKKDGYRSRSAYKLLEINSKFKILKRGISVLDLGAYPGGWSQVVLEHGINEVTAVDMQEMAPMQGVTFIKCDIREEELHERLGGAKFDVVLSDMAPKACGHREVDHMNIINLCEMARDVAVEYLKPGGVFITKILQGEYEQEFRSSLKQYFRKTEYCKPKSSRSESSEIYLVALEYNKTALPS